MYESDFNLLVISFNLTNKPKKNSLIFKVLEFLDNLWYVFKCLT